MTFAFLCLGQRGNDGSNGRFLDTDSRRLTLLFVLPQRAQRIVVTAEYAENAEYERRICDIDD